MHETLPTDTIPTTYSIMSKRSTKPAKLRNSCDACSIAKIKCTKEKPTCSRCESRGQTCIYGVSRRSGRPAQLQNDIPRLLKSSTTRPMSISEYNAYSMMHSPAASSDTSPSPNLSPSNMSEARSMSLTYGGFATMSTAVPMDMMRSNYVQTGDLSLPMGPNMLPVATHRLYSNDDQTVKQDYNYTGRYGQPRYSEQFPGGVRQGSTMSSVGFGEYPVNNQVLSGYPGPNPSELYASSDMYGIKPGADLLRDVHSSQQTPQSTFYPGSYIPTPRASYDLTQNPINLGENASLPNYPQTYHTFT